MHYREYGKHVLLCDDCADREITFEEFWDMVAFKKQNGWKSLPQGQGGECLDLCPTCNGQDRTP